MFAPVGGRCPLRSGRALVLTEQRSGCCCPFGGRAPTLAEAEAEAVSEFGLELYLVIAWALPWDELEVLRLSSASEAEPVRRAARRGVKMPGCTPRFEGDPPTGRVRSALSTLPMSWVVAGSGPAHAQSAIREMAPPAAARRSVAGIRR